MAPRRRGVFAGVFAVLPVAFAEINICKPSFVHYWFAVSPNWRIPATHRNARLAVRPPGGDLAANSRPAFQQINAVVLARAFADAGTTEPTKVCEALRGVELEGTRGTIRFSTERDGVVHRQWKWPPVCVLAYSHTRQAFSQADLLWDAEQGKTIGPKALREAG